MRLSRTFPALLLVIVMAPTFAAKALEVAEVSRCLRSDYTEMEVQGGYGYAAVSEALEIFDLTTPGLPQSVAVLGVPGDRVRGVSPHGDFVYVLNDSGDTGYLYVIDVSDPAFPEIVNTIATGSDGVATAIQGDYLYHVDGDSTLRVFDVSTPVAPAPAGSLIVAGQPRSIAIQGDYAYLGGNTVGLTILDISEPTNPSLAATLDTPGATVRILLEDTLAFLSVSSFGVHVVNIADPLNPIQIGGYNTTGYTLDARVFGAYLYLADENKGVVVLDVSDPTAPDSITTLDTPGWAYGLASPAVGDLLYVCDRDGGIAVLDVSNPVAPVKITAAGTVGDSWDIAIQGPYAYIACGLGGLRILDMTVPSSPSVVFDSAVTLGGRAVEVQDSLVFLGGYLHPEGVGGFYVLNAADPHHPTVLCSLAVGGYIGDFAVRDNYLYVVHGDFSVFDISDPANPFMTDSITGFYQGLVVVRGDYAYTDEGVYDISDPYAIVRVSGSWAGGGKTGFALRDSVIYVSSFISEFFIGFISSYSLSDPAAPALLHSLQTEEAWTVDDYGDYALAGTSRGLAVFDVSTPAAMDSVSSPWAGWLNDVAVGGNFALGAAGLGVVVWSLGETTCGDMNGSGTVNVSDATYLVDYLFRSGPAPVDMTMADIDASGSINISDLTYLIDFLFRGGSDPVCQ